MSEEIKGELLGRLRRRIAFDHRAAVCNFILGQIFVGTSILASFGAAIVAAANFASPIQVALLASIPGTVIIINQSFRFTDRWRWHCVVETRFMALEHKLVFENGNVEEVSRGMFDFLEEMEKKYPTGTLAWTPKRGPK